VYILRLILFKEFLKVANEEKKSFTDKIAAKPSWHRNYVLSPYVLTLSYSERAERHLLACDRSLFCRAVCVWVLGSERVSGRVGGREGNWIDMEENGA